MAYKRKTVDEFEIQGFYGYGWECVTTEETRKDGRVQLKCYRENDPAHAYRMVHKRVKKSEEDIMIKAYRDSSWNRYEIFYKKGV